jgi:hypothetical protein
MPTYERALTAQEQREFNHYAAVGMQMIDSDDAAAPAEITAAVHDFIGMHQHQFSSAWAPFMEEGDEPNIAAVARALGTVWGDQLVREFGWEWICIGLGRGERFVVAEPDRGLAVFAADYVEMCLESNDSDCAIQPAFDLLRTYAVPPQQVLSYTSTMRLVHLDPGLAGAQGSSTRERWISDFLKKIGARMPANDRELQEAREEAHWILR